MNMVFPCKQPISILDKLIDDRMVQYSLGKTYSCTVRDCGTAILRDAYSIIVLPESLGGWFASLGNHDASRYKYKHAIDRTVSQLPHLVNITAMNPLTFYALCLALLSGTAALVINPEVRVVGEDLEGRYLPVSNGCSDGIRSEGGLQPNCGPACTHAD
ncbi:hypothetical protein CALCODRAFT_141772 [Calocera cornea HHB12733]|uniref:Uncharacterized protein n=1 Tax=Calocera cornea HHB12733 TaxID=1353952 RepID=A0A165K5W0_9BASI|nr:hypothetical protein CALCODRAFT_141772 [Calocera cornea HHB12733]